MDNLTTPNPLSKAMDKTQIQTWTNYIKCPAKYSKVAHQNKTAKNMTLCYKPNQNSKETPDIHPVCLDFCTLLMFLQVHLLSIASGGDGELLLIEGQDLDTSADVHLCSKHIEELVQQMIQPWDSLLNS